jgi:DNA-binding transcriptional MocR family regulator
MSRPRIRRTHDVDRPSDAGAGSFAWAPEPGDYEGTKYEAVVDAISAGIASGTLKYGQRLPPQRELAKHFNVTIATMTKGIAEAARRGLVVARSGSGTFVSAPVAGASDPPAPIGEGVLTDLSLNTPPVTVVAEVLQDALQSVAGARRSDDLFGYEALPGSIRNRRAGATWMLQRGLDASPNRVLLTGGTHEGLLISLLAFTEPGDVILCEALNYTGLRRIGQMLRLKVIGIDVDAEGLDVEALSAAMHQHDVKAVVCTPATHNPTTAMLSEQRRARIVAVARQAHVPIIEDDIYGALTSDVNVPLAAIWPEGVVLVTSLSKAVAPGLRTGYIVAPDRYVARLRDTLFMLAWTGPTLQAGLATQLIETGAAASCVAAHQAEAARRMCIARRTLGAFLLTDDALASYHVWVDTGDLGPADVAAELYRRGVMVSPAQHFLVSQTSPPNAIRLSLGNVPERSSLEQSLRILRQILDAHRSVALGSIV